MKFPAIRVAVLSTVLITATLLYGAVIEPVRLTTTHVVLRDGRLARVLSGLTVVLVGDLHYGPAATADAPAVLRQLERIGPDLILLSGDYVQWGSRDEAYDHVFDFLSRLHAPLGVYGVLGDADTTSSRKSCEFCHEPGSGEPTRRPGAKMLKDEALTIVTGKGRIRLVGFGPQHLATAARAALLMEDDPTIVLSHSSVAFAQVDASRDTLVLSGDTHGGQVRLPGWFWRLTRFKPDPAHVHGFFREGRKALFVTRGVGTSHVRFRLGAPPEIAVFSFEDARER